MTDQSTLVQALDEIKRMTRDAFLRVGLDDYWKILPESITLSGKPCFEIVIRQNNMTENIIAPDEQITSLLRPNPFIGVDAENCKSKLHIYQCANNINYYLITLEVANYTVYINHSFSYRFQEERFKRQ